MLTTGNATHHIYLHPTTTETLKPADSRATKLLTKVMAAGQFDAARLALELVVDEDTLGMYLSGAASIPPERQLCLGRFLIANVPSLARSGHQLVAQAQATIRFSEPERMSNSAFATPRGRY